MRGTWGLAILLLTASGLQAGSTQYNFGLGMAYPLKPEAFTQTHNPGGQLEVGASYFLNDYIAVGPEFGISSFVLNQDRLNLPPGYSITGGADELLYYDLQVRIQSKVRTGVSPYFFAGFGLAQETVDQYEVLLNGKSLVTAPAKSYDPGQIGVWGAGIHFANWGSVSFYSALKLITTSNAVDAARFMQWTIGLTY